MSASTSGEFAMGVTPDQRGQALRRLADAAEVRREAWLQFRGADRDRHLLRRRSWFTPARAAHAKREYELCRASLAAADAALAKARAEHDALEIR